MNKSKFAILFWMKKYKLKSWSRPIWARIAMDGKRSEFSTNKKIHPKLWDAENNLAVKEFSEAKPPYYFLALMKLTYYDITIFYSPRKISLLPKVVKNNYKMLCIYFPCLYST